MTSTQVEMLKLTAGGQTKTYTYQYDANGNITSINDGSKVTTYVYDSLNQLTRENNQAAGKTWVWTYDNGGNITSKTEYNYTTGTLGTALDTITYTYGDDDWGDLLTAYDGVTITYDGIGNPLNDGTWTYDWNGRQLTSMTSGSTTWSYKYDSDGLRTSRSNGSTTYKYTYSGSSLVHMSVGSNTLYFTYDSNGAPMSVAYNGTNYYYVTNIQGDVIAILDSSGTKVVEYTYDAWGKLLSTSGTMSSTLGTHNPLLYRGYVYDHETKLYYLQSRYYNPERGRFINADAIDYIGADGTLLSNNLFAYCKNNPIMAIDPTGHFLLSTAVLIGAVVGGLIGAAIGGTAAYNTAKNNGAEGWELAGWTALGALGGGTVGAGVGAVIGYGVGYLAGGTYANGLAAKSVDSGVKTFLGQANKVHHVLSNTKHNLAGYTVETMETLMKQTLKHGIIEPYKSVQSAYLASTNSEVTFTIVKEVIKISDMWIR